MSRTDENSTALTTGSVEVVGQCVRSHSPLLLPGHVCVRCGSREPGGVIRDETVTYVSPWVWLTMLISWLVTLIAYYGTRKRIDVQYYLCPQCADRRKIRTVTSALVTLGSVAGLVVGIGFGEWTVVAPFLGSFFVSSIAWLAFSGPPLRAVTHDAGQFSLKGASPELLATLDRKQLSDHATHSTPAADRTDGHQSSVKPTSSATW
jgi:hypothetical protein